MNELHLSALPPNLKWLIRAILLSLALGVSLGLGLVFYSNSPIPAGINERIAGSESDTAFAFPDHYPMPLKELLITTHNHIISFTFIFALMALLIQFSGRLSPAWKRFLATEPFISILLTFGSMWGIRFISGHFVLLMLLSSSLMYLSYYLMLGWILWELGKAE